MEKLNRASALKDAINDGCDFDRPMRIVWKNIGERNPKQGDVVYDGADTPVGIERSSFFDQEGLACLGFATLIRPVDYDGVRYFATFYPGDFVTVLDNLVQEFGEEVCIKRLSYFGDVMVKTLFSAKPRRLVTFTMSEDIDIYFSEEDGNTLVVEGVFDVSSPNVDQGGQAGNFG